MAGALEHAALLRAQREDVAGLDQVVGTGVGSMATMIVRERSGAEMPVVMPCRASMGSVKAVA